jgi:hypothetical protein
MKYLILIAIFAFMLRFCVLPIIAIAEPISEVKFAYVEGDKIPEFVIDYLVDKYADGNKAYQMKRTIFCESGYANVQSYIIDRQGVREPSFGLAQIHLPSHIVTKEQALDVEFAVSWMSDNWEDTAWYGYNRILDKCN